MNNIQLGVSQSKGYENEEIFIVCCEVQYGSGSANYFLTDLDGALSKRICDAMVFKNKYTSHRYASSIECVYPYINLLGKVQETTFGFLLDMMF